MSTQLPTSAATVWARIGDFGTIHEWHPAVVSCSVEGNHIGSVRTLTLGDGAVIKERLDTHADAAMSFKYSLVDHPLPVDDYHAEVRAVDNGDGTSTMHWTSSFEATVVSDEEAKEIIAGIYQAGFEALKVEFGS